MLIVAVVALSLAVAALIVALAVFMFVFRWIWYDREQSRVQAKLFVEKIRGAVEGDDKLAGWADMALECWKRAREEAVEWRGRREPF